VDTSNLQGPTACSQATNSRPSQAPQGSLWADVLSGCSESPYERRKPSGRGVHRYSNCLSYGVLSGRPHGRLRCVDNPSITTWKHLGKAVCHCRMLCAQTMGLPHAKTRVEIPVESCGQLRPSCRVIHRHATYTNTVRAALSSDNSATYGPRSPRNPRKVTVLIKTKNFKPLLTQSLILSVRSSEETVGT